MTVTIAPKLSACPNCGRDRDEPTLKFCWRCRKAPL